MKAFRKPLIVLAAVALIVSVSVYASVAFFTDSEEVTNTFTVGKVNIKLDETDLRNPSSRTEDGNEYHLIPGKTYTKDPMITVLEDSEPCYVRMIVSINMAEELKAIFGENFLPENYVSGWNPQIWPCVSAVQLGNTLIYEFRYHEPVAVNGDALALDPLFDSFTIPGSVTGEQLATLIRMDDKGTDDPGDDTLIDKLTITVQGHAIQSEGFHGDADEAWAAFDGQKSSSKNIILPPVTEPTA